MENTRVLTPDDVLDIVRELSYSQGFYGRLLHYYILPDYENFCAMVEEQQFTDILDVIRFFEE